MAKAEKPRISGKDAAYVALDAAKYPPVRITQSDNSATDAVTTEKLPAPVDDQPDANERRRAPPRVRKPLATHDQYLAPTPDLAGYRARLREAFGNTMSGEFVDIMLGKVVEARFLTTVVPNCMGAMRSGTGIRASPPPEPIGSAMSYDADVAPAAYCPW